MRNLFFFLILPSVFLSCQSGPKAPDVSAIKVNLNTLRFEQDFFAIDTMHIMQSIGNLQARYPQFTTDFIEHILGLDLDAVMKGNPAELMAIKSFIQDYKPVKDSADLLFKDFSKQEESIRQLFRFVRYYFPEYELPSALITFVGPMDAYFQSSHGIQGDVLTAQGLGIGLQFHLGRDFSFYQSAMGQSLYPSYISVNFDSEHIPVNAARNIADDLFEDKSGGRALIEQMVEKGKFLYLISRFLPFEKEYLLIGYTKEQFDAARDNEGVIWSFFLNNDLLNSQELDIIKNYIGESPKTPEFGDEAPGNLGSFAGWQIVKKFMDKHREISLENLMSTNPREIYTQSRYKPRP